MITAAQFSTCRTYRYSLTRLWDNDKSQAIWIGMNPSTADEKEDDPTIRKLIGFCKKWELGGLHIVNICAYRSTDKRNLESVYDPVGPRNSMYLRTLCKLPGVKIICCWGNIQDKIDRIKESLISTQVLLSDPKLKGNSYCLGINNTGHPIHPLYVSYNKPLIPYLAQDIPI